MKQKMLKLTGCVLLATIIMMGMSGCMKTHKPEDIMAITKTWLEEKYGEEFVCLSTGNAPYGNAALTYCQAVNRPEYTFSVYYYFSSKSFEDSGYAAYLRQDEIVEYYETLFKEIYGELCKVFFVGAKQHSEYQNKKFNAMQPIVEFMQQCYSTTISMYTDADVESKDQEISNVKASIINSKIPTDVSICYMKKETFALLNAKTKEQINREEKYVYREDMIIRENSADTKSFVYEGNETP